MFKANQQKTRESIQQGQFKKHCHHSNHEIPEEMSIDENVEIQAE
jgi:hypothetical protein